MSSVPPFRTHLLPPTRRTSVDDLKAHMRAMRKCTRNVPLTTEDLLELAGHPDEDVVWLFVCHRGGFLGSDKVPKEIREKVCDKALKTADDEGVLWTPIIDELAFHAIFDKVAAENPAKIYEWGIPDDEVTKREGVSYQLAARLIPWIREQSNPEEIYPLLEYRAPHLWYVVGHALTVIDEHILQMFESAPNHALGALMENTHLREFLAGHWWKQYLNTRKHPRLEHKKNLALRRLLMLATQGAGLSEQVYADLIKHLGRISNTKKQSFDFEWRIKYLKQIVLEDKNRLNEKDIIKIKPILKPHEIEMLLSATPSRLEPRAVQVLIADAKIAKELSRSFTIPSDVLEDILKTHSNDSDILYHLAENPFAPISVLREIAQISLARSMETPLKALAKRKWLHKDPIIRSALVKADQYDIALIMLPSANQKEYPILLEKILKHGGPAAVVGELRRVPPPQGTQLPKQMLRELLSSPNDQIRLEAITLLGRYGGETKASEHQKEYRPRRKLP